MLASRREIVDSVLSATRQQRSQIGSLVEDYLNLTLQEMNSTGWAFRKNENHLWSFLRRKTTFSTVASTAEYVLGRDVAQVAILTQRETPAKIKRVTDQQLLRYIPDPTTASGNPRFYREWEREGVSTKLAVADTIDIVSGSASDAGSSDYRVTVVGYSGGILVSEELSLNGTSTVSGTITFDAREIWVSKRATTTGNITVTENSGGTTLLVLGKQERAPKFKVISLYPIPDSAITIYMEYFSRIRPLVYDSEVPNLPEEMMWIVRLGTLAKVYGEYLKDVTMGPIYEGRYSQAIRAAVANDKTKPDLIESLERKSGRTTTLARSEDAVSG